MSAAPAPIRFYFDFLSPYSYLASALIARGDAGPLDLAYRPVAFGSMLARLRARGPGEIPSRRRIGLTDVLLLATLHGIPLIGPPTHPFNSIYALRSVCAVSEEAARGRLVAAYFKKAWAEGRSLEDLAVLRSALDEAGVDQDPEAAATTRENREALKANIAEALDAGAWGVPTFAVDGLIFFGHDRLPLLRAYLDGRVTLDAERLDALLARPQPGRIV